MEFTGPLDVDASRGKFNQFVVNGRQLAFADELFRVRVLTPMQAYDHSAPPVQTGRELTEAGRELYNKIARLGGKGVTVTGDGFERMVRFTQDFNQPQSCIMVQDIRACPSADPLLEPNLAELLRQKQEKDAHEKAEKELAKANEEETAMRQEVLREEMRERLREERKSEKKKQPQPV